MEQKGKRLYAGGCGGYRVWEEKGRKKVKELYEI